MTRVGYGDLLKVPTARWGKGTTAPALIYGVSWDKTSSPTLTRTDDAVGMVANAGVDMTPVTNDFDTAQIYSEISEVTDGYGNTFVRIPAFYIRKTSGATVTWQISKTSHGADWYLPACFWDFTNSVALPYVDVGKYNAGWDGTRMTSKPNEYPMVNQNIVTMRTRAQANGAAYQQLDIHVMDVLTVLFYVEFATLHSQSVMAGFTDGAYNASHTAQATEAGANRVVVTNAVAALFEVGQSIGLGTSLLGNQIFAYRTITSKAVVDASNTALDFDGAAVNVTAGNIVYSVGWRSGFSSGIAASSGSVGSNSSARFPMMYRGIENVWGSVWQFVDGLNVFESGGIHKGWVCRNAASYASNLFAAPYEELSYANSPTNGYIVEMGLDPDRPFASLPTNITGGGTTTYYADYYNRNSGQRIALAGGGWYSGSYAGLSYWFLFDASGGAGAYFGARLVRKGA